MPVRETRMAFGFLLVERAWRRGQRLPVGLARGRASTLSEPLLGTMVVVLPSSHRTVTRWPWTAWTTPRRGCCPIRRVEVETRSPLCMRFGLRSEFRVARPRDSADPGTRDDVTAKMAHRRQPAIQRGRGSVEQHAMTGPLQDASDGALVVAIGRWRQEALAEAYRRHAGAVFRLARRVVQDSAVAEDVVREVFR